MMYTEDFTLSTLICDEDDRLTIWGLARLFQDVAGNHSDMYGVGFEGLKPFNKAWVLTHVYYNILRFPIAGERLTLKTWPKPDNGLIAPRDYQLVDSKGEICAASSSNWVLLDMVTRRVARLHDTIKPFEELDINSTKYSKLGKLVMPDEMQVIKKIDVPYSAIDHTRHVNNAEYVKWISDSINAICKPRGENRAEISELYINYLKETKYADKNVNMLFKEIDGDLFYQLTNSNGIAVNAKINLTI